MMSHGTYLVAKSWAVKSDCSLTNASRASGEDVIQSVRATSHTPDGLAVLKATTWDEPCQEKSVCGMSIDVPHPVTNKENIVTVDLCLTNKAQMFDCPWYAVVILIIRNILSWYSNLLLWIYVITYASNTLRVVYSTESMSYKSMSTI